MTFTETLLVRLGSALRGPLYNAWRRRTGRTEQNARTLQDLIALDVRNAIASTRIERDISSLAEYMAETLLPVFSTDGIAFSDNEKAAISLALAQTFERGGLGTQLFLQNDLSPNKLGNYYLSLSTDYRKDFTEREQTFLDACIKEICGRLLDVADQLPGLTAAFQREILQRQSALFALGQSILDEIKKFTEKSRLRSGLIVDNFNLLYRQAVKRAFGHVHVFGLDIDRISTRLALDISYISLRVGSDNVRVGVSEDYHTSFANIDTISHDLKADEILAHTRRALLMGHAGSGKTTLLQWLCTKMVDQSLTGRLAPLNRCVPFFIRLREFYEKDLPVGKQLISCASRALVEEVPIDWIGDILSQGRAVFLVDGIDEISVRQRAATRKWLQELIDISPHSYYIVTSRPSAVKNYEPIVNSSFGEYYLRPMSPVEIRTFIQYWHRALADNEINELGIDKNRKIEELEVILQDNRSLARLVTTPLLCAIICTLNLKSRLRSATSRADLYRIALRLLIHERDTQRQVSNAVYDVLPYDDKERLLSEIAYRLVKDGNVSASFDSLVALVGRLLSAQQIDRIDDKLRENPPKSEVVPHRGGSEARLTRVSRAFVEALVLRSGVFQEISPEAIQYIHKTFQEFLASISIRWHEDEYHLVRNFDLRAWNELAILTVTTTTRKKARAMLSLLLERGDKAENEGDRTYYYLLAGSCVRETFGLDKELSADIVRKLATILPPSNSHTASLLAGAGDLVVPLLAYKPGAAEEEVAHIIETLVQIDTSESKREILEYTAKSVLSDTVIAALYDAIWYVEDDAFRRQVTDRLVSRKDPLFYQAAKGGVWRATSRIGRNILSYLPRFRTLRIDAKQDVETTEILTYMSDQEDVNVERLTRLDLMNFRKVVSFESVRNFKLLRELNLINIGEIRNFDFLSSLDELKILRLVNIKDIADYDGFRYATSLEKVFISEIDDAVLEELRNALMQCDCQSYYWSDFLTRKAEIRGETGVQFWTTPEINQFKIDVGFR